LISSHRNTRFHVSQNKSLSDPTEPILAAQGLGWLVRKTISFGTIHLRIKHYQDEANVECIDAESAIAGIPGIKESRKANWTATERQDHVFGALISKLRRVDVTQLEHDFLKRGWSEDTIEHGVLHSHVESDTLKSNTIWAADQVYMHRWIEILHGPYLPSLDLGISRLAS
jgi:hypothetical protein